MVAVLALAFVTSRNREIAVISLEDLLPPPDSATRGSEGLLGAWSSRGYVPRFACGTLEQLIVSSPLSDRHERWDIRDYSGRRVLTVFRLALK